MSAGVNLLSNFLIVRMLSIQIFGEFAIFSSYLAFGGLLYIIIPPNYSIFKLQDNPNYKSHLLSFYILSAITFSLFAVLIKFLVFRNLGIFTIITFGITTYSLSFFDIKFQATGHLRKYFMMLFIVSLLKIALIIISFYANLLHSLSGLLWTMSIVQSIIIFLYLFDERDLIKNLIVKPDLILNTIQFIKLNFKSFTPYYLNTVLKRVRENSIILAFSKIISTETLGLFALFIKVASFVFGLSRNLEAFFMNRENIKLHRSNFNEKVIYFAIVLQLIYFVVGIIYLKIIVGTFFYFEVLVQSLLVYPHIYFLLARAEMLSNYNNKESNVSEFLYVVIVLIAFILSKLFFLHSLYLLLITFTLATFGLQMYMILKIRKSKSYRSV